MRRETTSGRDGRVTKRLTKLGLVAGMLVLVACVDETPVAEQTGTGCTTDRGSIVLASGAGFTRVRAGGFLRTTVEFEPLADETGSHRAVFEGESGISALSSETHLMIVGVGPPGSALVLSSDDLADPCQVAFGDGGMLAFAVPLRADLDVTFNGPDGSVIGFISGEQMNDLISNPGAMALSTP